MSILPNMKIGDPCPDCGSTLIEWVRWGKPSGNLVCPTCWSKFTPQGERIIAKKKVRYGKKDKDENIIGDDRGLPEEYVTARTGWLVKGLEVDEA
ncbi:MAG: hypothetical protein HXX80_07430 [Nitrososphaerales archaeon]|nr:hypothetical protein [Nitrososphaerales archaeon]